MLLQTRNRSVCGCIGAIVAKTFTPLQIALCAGLAIRVPTAVPIWYLLIYLGL
jgi:hypothetical protein